MKTSYQRGIKFIAVVMALCAFAMSAYSAVLIDELFESGYNRTLNNIANSNMAWFKGRSGVSVTQNVGSLSFASTGNLGADGQWGYFTDPTANFVIAGSAGSVVSDGHVLLGVGDFIKASVGLTLPTMPGDTSLGSLRFGLFDNPNPNRQLNDLNGGPSSTTFTNNPGFATFYSLMSIATNNGMSVLSHTTLTSANIFSSGGNFTTMGSGGGAMSGMSAGTLYNLSLIVQRPDATTWEIDADVRDALGNLVEGMGFVTNSGISSFNWMHLRWNSTTPTFNYSELKVEVSQIPEPSTLVLAGFGIALAAFSIRRRR